MLFKGLFFPMEIQFEHSVYWLFLILPASAALAFWLYGKSEKITGTWKPALGILRFLAFLLLGIFLLNPMINRISSNPEPPLVLVLQDGSSSMKSYPEKGVEGLVDEILNLQENHPEIQWVNHHFDLNLRKGLDSLYTGMETNLSNALSQITKTYAARKPSALFLVSDGNVNRGMNPILLADNLPFPIFSIGTGDTSVYPDIRIGELRHNQIAYLGNTFPLEVKWESDQVPEASVDLKIIKEEEVLTSKTIPAGDLANGKGKLTFELKAQEVGIQSYQLRIDALPQEINTENNQSSFRIEVLDSRKKILVLAAAPHPDLAALKQSLEAKENQEVTVQFIREAEGDLQEFSTFILHNLPNQGSQNSPFLQEVLNSKTPIAFIAGPKLSPNILNAHQDLVEVSGVNGSTDRVGIYFKSDFTLFDLTTEEKQALSSLPQTEVLFGKYSLKAEGKSLANQKLGTVQTDRPLIVYGQSKGKPTALFFGNNLWRWRLVNFAKEGSHDAFNALINKTIQFLSIDESKERFRVQIPTKIFQSKSADFKAYLYNQAFEPVNEPLVKFKITGEEGQSFDLEMNRVSDHYSLKIPALEEGVYSFIASTQLGNEKFEKAGEFMVESSSLEQGKITANHKLLKNLAQESRGEFFPELSQEKISEVIDNHAVFKPLIKTDSRLNLLIDFPWLLLIPFLILTVEWILRKWLGTY